MSAISAIILLMPAASLAQVSDADPISGTWTGDMAPIGVAARQAITVEFKLENGTLSGIVTGPPQRGTIRTGTFDPASGALQFEVQVEDGGGLFVFDGWVVTGTALGSVKGGGISGDFKINKGTRAVTAYGAQPGAGDADKEALKVGFTQVHDWVRSAAQLVPADRWDYRPVSTVRTFGQLVAHVADSYLFYCKRASDRSTQWSDAIEKGTTDKGIVTGQLDRAAAACATAYDSAGDRSQLMANIAHTNLHYGNIVTYLRMLGLVPPSS